MVPPKKNTIEINWAEYSNLVFEYDTACPKCTLFIMCS